MKAQTFPWAGWGADSVGSTSSIFFLMIFRKLFLNKKAIQCPLRKLRALLNLTPHTESLLEEGLKYFVAIWKVTGPRLCRGRSTTSRKIISVFRRVNKTHDPFPYSDKPENTRWRHFQRFYWHKVIPFTCCLLKRRLLSDCGKIILY